MSKMVYNQKLIILLGPNGVGKTHICKVLEKNKLAKYYSIEEYFMKKYITLDNFKKHRQEGYNSFELNIRSDTDSEIILFEESGISSQATDMINRLKQDYQVYLIEIMADLETCKDRVRQRGTKENFSKDDEFVINSEKKYLEYGGKKYKFDLKIKNNDLNDSQILSMFSPFF